MTVEIQGLADKLENKQVINIRNYKFVQGTLGGKEVVTSICGIGKVASASTASVMITHFDIDILINIGVAGGCKKTKQCDIVIGEQFVQHDYDGTQEDASFKKGQVHGYDSQFFKGNKECIKEITNILDILKYPYHVGNIATGDLFVANDVKSSQLAHDFNALAFDMESASIAQVCTITNTKYVSMRAISDNGDHQANMSFQAFLEQAAARAIEVISQFIINHN